MFPCSAIRVVHKAWEFVNWNEHWLQSSLEYTIWQDLFYFDSREIISVFNKFLECLSSTVWIENSTMSACYVQKGFSRNVSKNVSHYECCAIMRSGAVAKVEFAVVVFITKWSSFLLARQWCRWTIIYFVEPMKEARDKSHLQNVFWALGHFAPATSSKHQLHE